MNNLFLFFVSAFIWGSTWLMITFQYGDVPPLVSVVYRFALASLILFGWSLWRRQPLRFSYRQHFWIAIQGLLLYGFNYWATYQGIQFINSALAAVLSTSIVYFNVVFARLFLGDPIRNEVLLGATFGVLGIVVIFLPEIHFGEEPGSIWRGTGMVLVGSMLASLGNVVSAKTQRSKIPVMQANAFGMGYAAFTLGLVAWLSGYEFVLDDRISYWASLTYLALFGSVLAFGAFLTLLGRIGPDKAGYVTLVYPVIALGFSTAFEGYQWHLLSLIGLFAILVGNFVAMGKYQQLIRFIRQKNHPSRRESSVD